MAELIELTDFIVTGAVEVAFPSVPPEQREAIVRGLSDATREAIRQVVLDAIPPVVEGIQQPDDKFMIPSDIKPDVMRLILESESV